MSWLLVEQISMDYADCPIDGCGEAILLTELDCHLDMHTRGRDVSDDFNVDGSDSPQSDNFHVLNESNPHDSQGDASFHTTQLSSSLGNIPQMLPGPSTPLDQQETAKRIWRGLLKMPSSSKGSNEPSSSTASPVRLGVG
jgi:hypothetical protein